LFRLTDFFSKGGTPSLKKFLYQICRVFNPFLNHVNSSRKNGLTTHPIFNYTPFFQTSIDAWMTLCMSISDGSIFGHKEFWSWMTFSKPRTELQLIFREPHRIFGSCLLLLQLFDSIQVMILTLSQGILLSC